MRILYASDENYVRHAAVSMLSLMEANKDSDEIDIHLLSMGITPESAGALRELVTTRGRSLTIHELGDIRRWFDFSFDSRGFAPSALARLFLAHFLPEDDEKVLYLDCDTVVLRDLSFLFETDLGDAYLGMAVEPTVSRKRREELGLPERQPYFNSGVLLFNMPLWRAENAEAQVLDYYRSKGGNLMAPDQDALNGAFPTRIKPLPPSCNFGSVQIYYPWKVQKKICTPAAFCGEAEYQATAFPPAVVHFLGEERPWRAGNRHPYTPVYEQYLRQTPWRDTPPEEGWRLYFRCFYLFNALTKPFPLLRYHIIDSLIPLFMRVRASRRKKKEAN